MGCRRHSPEVPAEPGGPQRDGQVSVKGGQLRARPGVQEHGSDRTHATAPCVPSTQSAVRSSCQLLPLPPTASRLSLRSRPARPLSQHSLGPIPPSRGSPTSPSPSSQEARRGVTLFRERVAPPPRPRAGVRSERSLPVHVAIVAGWLFRHAQVIAPFRRLCFLISHNGQVALQFHLARDILYSLNFHPFEKLTPHPDARGLQTWAGEERL